MNDYCKCEHGGLNQSKISAILGSRAICTKCGKEIRPQISTRDAISTLEEYLKTLRKNWREAEGEVVAQKLATRIAQDWCDRITDAANA